MGRFLGSILLSVFATTNAAWHGFSNPTTTTDQLQSYQIPTAHESTILARRMLNLTLSGYLSSVFAPGDTAPSTSRAGGQRIDIGGAPISLIDYYAACAPYAWNPILLAVNIATPIRNSRAGSNISLSINWTPPDTAPPSSDPHLYSPMNMPRFNMLGYLEPVSGNTSAVENCFLDTHPDVFWIPGSDIHESFWARLIVEAVYWFGGFGDRAYIGWLPMSSWRSITAEDISRARLVGEEGYEAPILQSIYEQKLTADTTLSDSSEL